VAWELAEAGYTVELDVWDWAAGRNFVAAMSDALGRCDRVVALFSAAYFAQSRYTSEEWAASLVRLPGVEENRLVPVRVEDVPVGQTPPLLRPLVARDVFGLAEEQARWALLEAVVGPVRPDHKPMFPGRGTVRASSGLGGSGPRCSRLFTVSMKVTLMMAMCRHGEPRRAGCRAGFRWPGCRGGGQSVVVSSAMAVRAADSSAMVLPAV